MAEVKPARWHQRIERSLKLQKDRKDEAARFMRGYSGDYGIKPKKGIDDGSKDEMSINFVYSYVETVRPTIMPGTPRAFIDSLTPDSDNSAPHYQAVINHWVRTLGLKKELKKCVHDWFFGMTAFLTEWEYEEELLWVPNRRKKAPLIDPNTGEQQFNVICDRPVARRLDPWDVLLDADADSREEDKHRIVRLTMTKSEFNALPGVGSQMKKAIKGRALPQDLLRQPVGTSRDGSPERNYVILWRIYDLENETVKLLPEGESVRDFVEIEDWPWEMDVEGDRYPVTILEAKRDGDNPYSFSPFKAFWSQIQEKNKVRTMLQSTVRRSAPGWVFGKGAMDEEQKNAFMEAKIGEATEANKPDGILVRPLPKLTPEFFQHDQHVSNDLLDVSGLDEYVQQQSQTATEASIQNNRSSIRKGEAKSEFTDFAAVIYGKLGQLSQQFMSEKVAVKIKAPSGPDALSWMKPIWTSVNKEHIQGDFHLTCKPGVDDYQDEGLRRQQDLKFAQLMASNPHVDQRKLAVRIARSFDMEADEILKAPEQVQQEQAAQAAANTKPPPKPELSFKPIDPEMLRGTPEIGPFIMAALQQNNVPIAPGMLGGPGLPPAGNPGVAPVPGSPSMAVPGPGSSVMPGAAVSQPPALPGGGMPPPTPVMPGSEMQGGPQ